MFVRPVSALVVLAAAASMTGQDVPSGVLLLSKIKRAMQTALENVPNYTCLETIEREHLTPKARTFNRTDTVRLEVAELEGRELFSWPGASKFEEKSLTDFMAGGLVGNGAFALHSREVFMSNAAVFEYRGEEQFQGRPAYRYDFRISSMLGGYKIAANGHSALVGQSGYFLVDPNSFDLIEIEVAAEDIPPELAIAEAVTRIDYSRTLIGPAPVLLPQRAEMTLKNLDGSADRNRMEFAHCRQYSSESVISFDSQPQEAATAQSQIEETSLPAGLTLAIVLDTPVESEQGFVGAPIRGHVRDKVAVKGETIVPAGAPVRGRIRRLEHYTEPTPYFIVGLEFNELELPGRRARFCAGLQQMQELAGLALILQYSMPESRLNPDGRQSMTKGTIRTRDLPGIGAFFMKGERFQLPKGMWTLWKTGPAPN